MRLSNYLRYFFDAIGSSFEIELIGEMGDLSEKVKKYEYKVREFEKRFSRFIDDSEISKLNNNVGKICLVSEDLMRILRRANSYSQITDGYFNIGVEGALAKMGYGQPKGPSDVSSFKMEMSGNNQVMVTSTVDLGGLGKGLLLDLAKEEFKEFESVLVNGGGDIYVRGKQLDGSKRRVFFENPLNLEEYWGYLDVDDELFLASSNSLKRRWGEFHHLINPLTGKVAEEMAGVYVQGNSGELVDVISTSLFVMGYEKAKSWLDKNKAVEAALVSKEGLVYKTEGFKGEIL